MKRVTSLYFFIYFNLIEVLGERRIEESSNGTNGQTRIVLLKNLFYEKRKSWIKMIIYMKIMSKKVEKITIVIMFNKKIDIKQVKYIKKYL